MLNSSAVVRHLILLNAVYLWVLAACVSYPLQSAGSPLNTDTRVGVQSSPTRQVFPSAAVTNALTTIEPVLSRETVIATRPPLPTPLPSPTSTRIVSGLFANLWKRFSAKLGAPLAGNDSDKVFPPNTFREQPFQRGHIFWVCCPNKRLWVVVGSGKGPWTGSGNWRQYRDTWVQGSPVYSCKQAESLNQPRWAIGKVWCDNPDIQRDLGLPIDRETDIDYESGGALSVYRLQEFEKGFIFRDSDGWSNEQSGSGLAYVLFSDGTYVRQSYR